MTTSEVLNFTEMPIVDNGIERFEFHEYEPVARTNLNSAGKIRINIEQQDLESDDDAVFKLAAAALGKVNLNKISLFIPHEIPSDVERINLYKSIESKVTLPVSFRARQCDTISVALSTTFSWRLSVKSSPEKPRYIIVAFQTSRDGDQNANALIFGHCDLKNMYIMLNQERYPAVDYNLSFPNQQFSRAYRDAALKQSERLKSSTIDVQIKATFNAAVPTDTEAIAVVISDRMIKFQLEGNKINVVY
ncbi:uncharacterized protein LOC136089891 [Hydra vulgaris]|uniref:Uncharacterized protein LOC136089891 n=1 Tax=Hydra vulgaris TaxID=6087 RepID=A0ABM4DCF1_HYDVU